MTLYGLHAHELDPRKATGIARYALGLEAALQEQLRPDEQASLVTARGSGAAPASARVIDRSRKGLYARWLATRRPLLERFVPDLDLVHATAPIIPIGTRKPVVVTVHDLMPLTHPEWFSRQAVVYFRSSIAWAKRNADALLAVSEFVGAQTCELLGVSPDRVVVTGEGFDISHFRDDPEAAAALGLDQPYVVYLGSITVRKNLLTAIEALPDKGPQLVIAGPDGMGAEDVRRAAAARGDRVRIVGPLPEEQLGPLLRGALALVHPSKFEGFGLTVLEAMGLGTPVIVSSAGSLPELVGGAGHIVASNDVAGWRSALEIAEDPAALRRLSESGLRRAQDWSWETAAERTLAVYRDVVRTG